MGGTILDVRTGQTTFVTLQTLNIVRAGILKDFDDCRIVHYIIWLHAYAWTTWKQKPPIDLLVA